MQKSIESKQTQICHLCERIDCCDNDNPLVLQIKGLEKDIQSMTMKLEAKSVEILALKEEIKELCKDIDNSYL